MTLTDAEAMLPVCGMFFRGDNRPPHEADGPFNIGFSKKDIVSRYAHYRQPSLNNHLIVPTLFAANPALVVSTSRDLKVAADFPLNGENESWIYVVFIEKGINVSTHGYQKMDKPHLAARCYNFFYAQEVITTSIPANHIVAAFKIERNYQNLRKDTRQLFGYTERINDGTFKILLVSYHQEALEFLNKNFPKYLPSVEGLKNALNKLVNTTHRFVQSQDGYKKNQLTN